MEGGDLKEIRKIARRGKTKRSASQGDDEDEGKRKSRRLRGLDAPRMSIGDLKKRRKRTGKQKKQPSGLNNEFIPETQVFSTALSQDPAADSSQAGEDDAKSESEVKKEEPVDRSDKRLYCIAPMRLQRYVRRLTNYSRLQRCCRLGQLFPWGTRVTKFEYLRLGALVKGVPLTYILEDKVVGLYMFHKGNLMHNLLENYKLCMDKLQVVAVLLDDGQRSKERFSDMLQSDECQKWWCIEWLSPCIKAHLKKVTSMEDGLIMAVPDNKYVEIHGSLVMEEYGLSGYPFTRKSIVKASAQKMRELFTIEWVYENILRDYENHKEELKSLILSGKCMLYIDVFGEATAEIENGLDEWYKQMQTEIEEFQVVFLGDRKSYNLVENRKSCQWWICNFYQRRCVWLSNLLAAILPVGECKCGLLGFGGNGKVSCFRNPCEVAKRGLIIPMADTLEEDMSKALGCDDEEAYVDTEWLYNDDIPPSDDDYDGWDNMIRCGALHQVIQ